MRFSLVLIGSHWFSLALTGSHWLSLALTGPSKKLEKLEGKRAEEQQDDFPPKTQGKIKGHPQPPKKTQGKIKGEIWLSNLVLTGSPKKHRGRAGGGGGGGAGGAGGAGAAGAGAHVVTARPSARKHIVSRPLAAQETNDFPVTCKTPNLRSKTYVFWTWLVGEPIKQTKETLRRQWEAEKKKKEENA